MIHTLGYPRATVIQMQHTELILRPRQKPLAISAPTRIIAALLSRTAPPVARSFIASLFLNFFCGMRVAISMSMPHEIGAARIPAKFSRPQHRITH